MHTYDKILFLLVLLNIILKKPFSCTAYDIEICNIKLVFMFTAVDNFRVVCFSFVLIFINTRTTLFQEKEKEIFPMLYITKNDRFTNQIYFITKLSSKHL